MQRFWFITLLIAALPLTSCTLFRPAPPELTKHQVYLRGDFNDWFSEQDKFMPGEGYQMVLSRELEPGQYQFLISDRDGSCKSSFGLDQASPANAIASDSSVVLTACQSAEQWQLQHNSLSLVVEETSTWHFTIRADAEPPRLVVVKGVDSEIEHK